MASTLVTTTITILLFIGALAWILVMAYWILGKFGLWKFATRRRLNKRYRDVEFNDKIIEWCLHKFERRWSFKDVRRFSKYEKNRGEILYTYLMLDQLPKAELKAMIERRSNYDEKQSRRIEEEARSNLPRIPTE